ncbi:hypothetical protein ACPCAE_16850 [Streptomyces cinereoruber]|uniref:hypothetical protein n=1 Tax=Streptomyces cinereoruber TaxID=67260 RepID=UPI003C2D1B0E
MPELINALTRQGLRDARREIPAGILQPKKASLIVYGGNNQPTLIVPRRGPSAGDQVDALWHQEAERLEIFDRDREFLLFATYPGTLARGWIRVKDSNGTRTPSRIAAATGHSDFIAVSLDGKSLCAVSYEEYEIWIVTHSFQDARPETVEPTPECKSRDTGENRP